MIETYPIDIASELKTKEDIQGFIEASIEEAKDDTDPKYLIHALDTAARARSMLNIAQKAGTDRILSGETDPRASTLARIANTLGYRLTFVKQQV
jgi:probable addiction module antidote protein